MAARIAADDSRKLTLPKTAADYKPGLPSDFKAPEGLEFTVDEQDPLIARYRDFAHKHGMDQATFTEGMGLIAALRVGEVQEIKTARDAELAKLGTTAPARIDAMNRWLDARGAAALKGSVWTAEQVEAIEHLIQAFQTQGASAAPAHHAEQPSNDGKIPGFDKMTFEQRMAAIDAQRLRARAN